MKFTEESRIERIKGDLETVKAQLINLLTDQEIYWRLQNEVIKHNIELLKARSAFFDLLNDSYATAMAVAVRRLSDPRDKHNPNVSLRTILEEVLLCPSLVQKIGAETINERIAKLEGASSNVSKYVDRVLAHTDRREVADIPTLGDLKKAISALGDVFHDCYVDIAETDTELVVSFLVDPLDIFRFAWKH